MINIIVIAPTKAVGGINSWFKNVKKSFPVENFTVFYVDNRAIHINIIETNKLKRYWTVIAKRSSDLIEIIREVRILIREKEIRILHVTTVGSFGTVRDYVLGRICRKRNVKSIMHCHYGNLEEVINSKSIYSKFLLHVMSLYDKIWVLDYNGYKKLEEVEALKSRVDIVPNPIECPDTCEVYPTEFKKVAFVANVIPAKGIFDLVNAIVLSKEDIELTIVGGGLPETIEEINRIAKQKAGQWLKIVGRVENVEAREIIKSSDILALPTYLEKEAFPISILEAMSYGKMVVATNRAAIGEMLYSNGIKCGIFVKEKNPESIKDALEFCIRNPLEANLICKNAFTKVKENYSNKVVFKIMEDKYMDLLA